MSERGLAIDEQETVGGGVTRDAAFAGLADHHLDRSYRLERRAAQPSTAPRISP
jgi:hypothetical protein